MKHAKTPWDTCPDLDQGTWAIFDARDNRVRTIGEANARHIVRCVNNHDDLVGKGQRLVLQLRKLWAGKTFADDDPCLAALFFYP